MEDGIYSTGGRERDLDPEVIKQRNFLFQKYVTPYYNMIYKLTMQYSWDKSHVEENYNEVLVNFYKGIETYDPSRSILTWLHIVTKRFVRSLERKRNKYVKGREHDVDVDKVADTLSVSEEPSINMFDIEHYRDFFNDDILWVLDRMKPIHRDALLLQEAGYSLKEIADIEYDKGTLKSHNIETIKSRLFLARQFMKKYLTKDGERKMD